MHATDLKPLLLSGPSVRRMLDCGNTKYWELVKTGFIDLVDVAGRKMATYESVQRIAAGSASKTKPIMQPEPARAAS